jgi:hypothetical protein
MLNPGPKIGSGRILAIDQSGHPFLLTLPSWRGHPFSESSRFSTNNQDDDQCPSNSWGDCNTLSSENWQLVCPLLLDFEVTPQRLQQLVGDWFDLLRRIRCFGYVKSDDVTGWLWMKNRKECSRKQSWLVLTYCGFCLRGRGKPREKSLAACMVPNLDSNLIRLKFELKSFSADSRIWSFFPFFFWIALNFFFSTDLSSFPRMQCLQNTSKLLSASVWRTERRFWAISIPALTHALGSVLDSEAGNPDRI